MLVHGDAARELDTTATLRRLGAGLAAVDLLPHGLPRRAAWTALLIEAGELAQGLLDEEFARDGVDRDSLSRALLQRLLLAVARGDRLSALAAVQVLPTLPLPGRVRCRTPEGYAFHALYPESYAAAARASGFARARRPVVLSLRSIGTSLGAAVAATCAEPVEWLCARPVGPPSERRLSLAGEIAARVGKGGSVAVVDEGPGRSGSSFGAAAQWLLERGVAPAQITFFPSHADGPGPAIPGASRAGWAGAARTLVTFDELFLHPQSPRPLSRWFPELTGAPLAPLEDLGRGRWRARAYPREEDWPAVHVLQERRKYLLQAERGLFRLKFAGLGRHGEAAITRSRQLALAGFAPRPLAFLHGFLLEPYLACAPPLRDARQAGLEPLLERVSRYLAFRARQLTPGDGATLQQLLRMAQHNIRLGLGSDAAAELGRFDLARLEKERHPVDTDNKLQLWEWCLLPDGTLLKTDGVDHSRGDDLVGAQDLAWDVVGAAVELSLGEEGEEELAGRLAALDFPCARELRAFHRLAYLAFQLGAQVLAAEALAGGEPAEEARLSGRAEWYRGQLRAALGRG